MEPAVVVRVHPGQWFSPRPVAALGVALALAAAPAGGLAQAVERGAQVEPPVPADTSDVLGAARAAQARFERARVRFLPVTLGGATGTCDERVGRFCSWYDEGDWSPQPEDPRIVARREELLATLDSAQRILPADDWLLGQRVWYRGEAGRWAEARNVAAACNGASPWWCAALEGLALHALGRTVDAEAAFRRALAGMEPERAHRWRVPRRAVDRDARRILDAAAAVSPDSLAAALARLWALADPLWILDGNDRRTEHYARWTVSEIRRRARNPYGIRWGDDLEELTVRHGWELGWERSPTRDFASLGLVVGHKHPKGRDFMPPGSALRRPAGASREELRAHRSRPRSLYAPAYAPVFLPMDAQLARFPRLDGTVVVATVALPEDTTRHAMHRHPVPWRPAADARDTDAGSSAGLVLATPGGAVVRRVRHPGVGPGSLTVRVPPGAYVASVEVWSPAARRAGRLRQGLEAPKVLEDLPTLSDLLLLAPWGTGTGPASLEEAVARAWPGTVLGSGQPLAVAWEVSGLGFRPEVMRFEVTVRRRDRGLLRRLGEALRLVGRAEAAAPAWEVPAPSEPRPHFEALQMDLSRLKPGTYEITLTLHTATRAPVERRRTFRVAYRVDPSGPSL